jgi:thiol-disulfide isomerase/thioredoxin
MNERVIFYPPPDLAFGSGLVMAAKKVNNYDETKIKNIDDILELHNIKKYFDTGIKMPNWTEEEYAQYKNTVKCFPIIIGKFLSPINDENFIKILSKNKKSHYYIDDFLEIIVKYKTYENISEKTFKQILNIRKIFYLPYIVNFPDLVNHYGAVIKEMIKRKADSAVILLDKYAIGEKEIYLPKELTVKDKEQIINNYLNSKHSNLNQVRLIVNLKDEPNEIALSEKTRLKAKQICTTKEKELLAGKNATFESNIKIGYSRQQDEVKKIENIGQNTEILYSVKWLEDNNDYPTLLNNFIYLFDFVDIQCRFNYVSNPRHFGIFERINSLPKHYYPVCHAFDYNQRLLHIQTVAYYQQLNDIGIRLEEVIEWFFKIYLKKEFGIKNYQIEIPSKESTYLEKCRTIAPEMEKVLKEYKLFVEYNKINAELLKLTRQKKFNEIPSKLQKKYAYIKKGPIINGILHCLFSDQTILGYFGHGRKKYDNLYDALTGRDINIDEYKDYQKQDINFLIKNKIVYLTKDNKIKFVDLLTANVLKDFYYHKVVSYWHYPKLLRNKLDILFNNGYVKFGNTLFSQQEIDYMNFYLNESEFVNGRKLRNSYLHGTEENDHENNYMFLLAIFILIVIKINDDLCLFDNNAHKNNS